MALKYRETPGLKHENKNLQLDLGWIPHDLWQTRDVDDN